MFNRDNYRRLKINKFIEYSHLNERIDLHICKPGVTICRC